ncbi:hypothetical protein FOPG_20128 [Fusarium oxysporum f. sp. conglutinans race 2 54008]|uniref:Uncharacterized protein n=1 Tax=Fusarium oxysporum f. sp. conglutinans race 2 54008 TaxID=1089457 RepID=X0GJW0_FUSOX|nr:hypothetical protein FOPG_20128 [Fusarium oxysporum f. sp. conglutinans race 2 54008]
MPAYAAHIYGQMRWFARSRSARQSRGRGGRRRWRPGAGKMELAVAVAAVATMMMTTWTPISHLKVGWRSAIGHQTVSVESSNGTADDCWVPC